MSDPILAPNNEDSRPKDIIRDQTESRASSDPRGEAETLPPPMPRVNAGSTVSLNRAAENLIQDVVQASLTQAFRNMTINGASAQVTNNSIDFALPNAPASERFAQQNPNPTEPTRDSAAQRGVEVATQVPERLTLMGSTLGLGSNPTPIAGQRVRDRGGEDDEGSNIKNSGGTSIKQDKDAESKSERFVNEKGETLARINPSNFGKGHVRALFTRADGKQKIVANLDIASGGVVEGGGDDDDENDKLPEEESYYFGGFGYEFYCWKKGVLGTIRLSAGGPFKPLEDKGAQGGGGGGGSSGGSNIRGSSGRPIKRS